MKREELGVRRGGMRIALFSVLVTVLPAAAQVNFYSMEKEAALGAQLASQVRGKTAMVGNATVRAYVEKIGGKLAAVMPGPPYTFTFAVTVDGRGGQTHEPLSLPGGYIFVPADLILTAQNEAEFAGMLAHAMAHVVARHGTRQATKGQLVNYGSVPLIFMGGWMGEGNVQGAGVPQTFARFQRAFEGEADTLAIRFLSRTGYDPKALAGYISRVQIDDRAGTSSVLPPLAQRMANMETAIQSLAPAEYAAPGDEFPGIQTVLRQSMQ
jgi:predicted Zn-dependent protease